MQQPEAGGWGEGGGAAEGAGRSLPEASRSFGGRGERPAVTAHVPSRGAGVVSAEGKPKSRARRGGAHAHARGWARGGRAACAWRGGKVVWEGCVGVAAEFCPQRLGVGMMSVGMLSNSCASLWSGDTQELA